MQKFKNSVQGTFDNRKKLILGFPKRKIWKLRLINSNSVFKN